MKFAGGIASLQSGQAMHLNVENKFGAVSAPRTHMKWQLTFDPFKVNEAVFGEKTLRTIYM